MVQLTVKAWNAEGGQVKDTTVPDPTGEGAEFFAHQLLHAEGVVCVEVSDGTDTVRRCDPGVDFATVVGA
jgi:hypothetical protein